MYKLTGVFMATLLLALGGCASTPEDPLPENESSSTDADGLQGRGLDRRPEVSGGTVTIPQRDTSRDPADATDALVNIIYFEFDSAQIDSRSEQIIDAHATRLRRAPDSRVRLEGHTDERGTREYNIALGERRADAVRRALLLRGVARAQISVVSYGEESPVAFGSGESAWAQNRRVELNYLR